MEASKGREQRRVSPGEAVEGLSGQTMLFMVSESEGGSRLSPWSPKKTSVCCRDMDELWTYFDVVWNGFIPPGIAQLALFI